MREQGKTLIMVTHDPGIASAADRQIRFMDGRITEIIESRTEAAGDTEATDDTEGCIGAAGESV